MSEKSTIDKDTLDRINEKLSSYTDLNCLNCYARLESDGRIRLDDRFKIDHLIEIIKIASRDQEQ